MALKLPGASGDGIDIGDIANARFRSDPPNNIWSLLCFFNVASQAGDESGFVGKWSQPTSNKRQFVVRISQTPHKVQVFHNAAERVTGATTISLNKWYCIGIRMNDGAMVLWTIDLSNFTFVDDGVTGSSPDDRNDLTESINFGGYSGVTNDPLNGSIDHISYFNRQFIKEDVLAYARNPEQVVAQYHSTCEFYFQLGRGMVANKTGGEKSLEGKGITGTYIAGGSSAITAAIGPPVRPRILGDVYLEEITATPVSRSILTSYESKQQTSRAIISSQETLQKIAVPKLTSWEAKGEAMGFVVSVEAITAVIPLDTAFIEVNLSKNQNISNCIPFVTYSHTAGGTADQQAIDAYFVSGTPNKLRVERSAALGPALTAVVYVLEVDGSGVKIHQGTYNLTGQATDTINLIVPLQTGGREKAFMTFGIKSSSTDGEYRIWTVRGRITSDTQIVFDKHSGDTNCVGHWFIAESIGNYFTTEHLTADFNSTQTSIDLTLSTDLTDINRAIVLINFYSTLLNSDSHRNHLLAQITSSTNINVSKITGQAQQLAEVTAIQFVGANASVQRGTLVLTNGVDSTKSATITDVDENKAIIVSGGTQYLNAKSTGDGFSGISGVCCRLEYASDGSEVKATREVVIGTTTVQYEAVELLLAGSGVSSAVVTSYETKSFVSSAGSTPYESNSSAVSSHITSQEALVVAFVQIITTQESLTQVSTQHLTTQEVISQVSSQILTSWESMAQGVVSNIVDTSIEGVSGATTQLNTSIESLGSVTNQKITSWESLALGAVNSSIDTSIEGLGSVTSQRITSWEAEGAEILFIPQPVIYPTYLFKPRLPFVITSVSMPVSSQGRTGQEAKYIVSSQVITTWEVISSVVSSAETSYEADIGVTSQVISNWESRIGVTSQISSSWESRVPGQVTNSIDTSIEWLGAVANQRVSSWESRVPGQVANSIDTSIEWTGPVSANTNSSIEYISGGSSTIQSSYESLIDITTQIISSWESQLGELVSRDIATDYEVSSKILRKIISSIEAGGVSNPPKVVKSVIGVSKLTVEVVAGVT